MSGPGRLDPKVQEMPLDRAILWNPPAAPGSTNPGRSAARSPYPIFFQQEAVIALQDHLKSSPTQAIFGFLIGDVFRDPDAGALYTVIDKTLKLSQPIYGDKTEVVVSRLWDRMQEQLKKVSATLLGWYHSHPGQGGFLTPHDVETHEKFFKEPWHVAVLVAAEAGGVTGRFFRASQAADWSKTPIPFHELLQPDSIKPDGKKRSFITWRNYKAFGPTLTGPKPKAAPPAEEKAEPVEEADEPPTPKPKKPSIVDKVFRIMRSSADDIPVIRTSADDEPAPPPEPTPPPPPEPEPPPPPPPRAKREPSAPVFVAPADERAEAPPTPPPQPPPPAPPPPLPERRPVDDIPWTVTPESVASVPPPVIEPPPAPPAPPAPREARRTPAQSFRLLDEAPPAERPVKKKAPRRRRRIRGPWLNRLVMLLVLAGLGAGAYWYVVTRHPKIPPSWIGLLDRAKKLVSGSPSPAPVRGASRRQSPVPQPVPPTARAAQAPVLIPTAPPAPAPTAPLAPPPP
ncbi:MAG TPA: hypothetical protein VG454_02485, partial [Gemmatimonadales bacterium]|nr:hypothetical protein [Gemmatimonadales bacterium]